MTKKIIYSKLIDLSYDICTRCDILLLNIRQTFFWATNTRQGWWNICNFHVICTYLLWKKHTIV